MRHATQLESYILTSLCLTACVAAGRLAAANPGLEILVVEQGPNNLNDPMVVTPALFMSHLAPGSKTA